MMWRGAAVLLLSACAIAGESSHNEKNATTESTNITKTVIEVEKILDNYPELPRIERSEIMSILENITEEDSARLKDELRGVLEEEKLKMLKNPSKEEAKTTDKKPEANGSGSVMVVMPFKPEDQEESLEELYTRSPIVRMEKQKTPTRTKTENDASTTPPVFSKVEKEDGKFRPPLRVIGFRYETTPGPDHTDNSPRTYANFQNPEQVTRAFTAQQFQPSHSWNHKGFDPASEPSTSESTQPKWEDSNSAKTTVDQSFHEPASMDNFSLEDVMMDTYLEPIPTTLRNYVEIITPEPTTEKIMATTKTITTTALPITTTEYIFTTSKPVKRKNKPKPQVKTTTAAPTTTTKVPTEVDLDTALQALPPDLKEMLKTIGVNNGVPIENSESQELVPPPQLPQRTVNAQIDATSYMSFKPIPVKKQKFISDDMQEFLASFGLLDGHREQKAAVEETTPTKQDETYLENTPQINSDILTDSMKETLETLGLYQPKAGEATRKVNKKKHVFNPKEHMGIQSDEEVKKLNALLNTIKKLASLNDSEPVTPEFQQEIIRQVKELDNITISYKTSAAINEEIHKIMARNKGKFKIPIVMKESSSINPLQSGLDPAFFSEIELKNEVKRQENSTSVSSTTTEGSTSTTTEPSNSAGLEDAFGGGDTAPQDANPADSLPPKRPNGLYLLLDWNTFFEVGTEDDARRVNIRFQPKIGDGRNFLPVAIP